MFQQMRRKKQQLDRETCIAILDGQPRGALSVIGEEGYPYTVPMDYYYDKEKDRIYFHGSKVGEKIDALRHCNKVSFCVWTEGYRKPDDWPLIIKSVVVRGRIRLVEGEERIEMARKIGLKYYPSPEAVEQTLRDWKNALLCLELIPDHMSGKVVTEE